MKAACLSFFTFVAVASILFLLPVSASAAIIVGNWDFEDTVTVPGGPSVNFTGLWYPDNVPQWTVTPGSVSPPPASFYGWAGVFDPLDSFAPQPVSGSQVAFINSGSIEQELGAAVDPGAYYRLVVAVGRRTEDLFTDQASFTVEIYGGTDLLGTVTQSITVVTAGTMQDIVLDAVAPSNATGNLKIVLRAAVPQVLLDDVRLYELPEPGAFVLIGSGLFGVILHRLPRRA